MVFEQVIKVSGEDLTLRIAFKGDDINNEVIKFQALGIMNSKIIVNIQRSAKEDELEKAISVAEGEIIEKVEDFLYENRRPNRLKEICTKLGYK